MATKAPSGAEADVHDVYISHAERDADAARWLAERLTARGLRAVSAMSLRSTSSHAGTVAEALEASRALVVLWGMASAEAPSVAEELERFQSVHHERGLPALVVPVVLGPAELLRRAPPG